MAGRTLQIIRAAVWWHLIQVSMIAALAAMFWLRPDDLRHWLETASDQGEAIATPFTGHLGLLISQVVDQWLVLGLLLALTAGGVVAAMSQQLAVWRLWGRLLIVPIIAKVVMVSLVATGNDGWLIDVGRAGFDALPDTAQRARALMDIEGYIQLLTMCISVSIAIETLRPGLYFIWKKWRRGGS